MFVYQKKNGAVCFTAKDNKPVEEPGLVIEQSEDPEKDIAVDIDGQPVEPGGGGDVEGTSVKSTGVEQGKVLTADGEGGASWEDAGGNVESVNGQTGEVVLTKSDIGLGNVDNTSDADKPISTATQSALDNKQATLVSGTNIKTINNTSILGLGNIQIRNKSDVSLFEYAPISDTGVTSVYDENTGIISLKLGIRASSSIRAYRLHQFIESQVAEVAGGALPDDYSDEFEIRYTIYPLPITSIDSESSPMSLYGFYNGLISGRYQGTLSEIHDDSKYVYYVNGHDDTSAGADIELELNTQDMGDYEGVDMWSIKSGRELLTGNIMPICILQMMPVGSYPVPPEYAYGKIVNCSTELLDGILTTVDVGDHY